MLGFTPFKKHANKFNYIPRYYDPEKEAREQRRAELDRIIADENLNHDEAYKFMDNAFRDGFVQTTGTAITKVLPPVSRFTPTGDRTKKREAVIERLTAFFNRFWDIISETKE